MFRCAKPLRVLVPPPCRTVLYLHVQVLNARVYDVAIDSPLQEAVNMSREVNNHVLLKVSTKIRTYLTAVSCSLHPHLVAVCISWSHLERVKFNNVFNVIHGSCSRDFSLTRGGPACPFETCSSISMDSERGTPDCLDINTPSTTPGA